MYNTGSYVLGVLIARAAGQPLEAFFRERIFAPLGMKDTSFSVPPEKLDRLAPSYWPHPQTGALELHDGVADSQWSRPPASSWSLLRSGSAMRGRPRRPRRRQGRPLVLGDCGL